MYRVVSACALCGFLTYIPTCCRFILADTFGDGWDTAHFFMYDYKGTYSSGASSCSQNVLTKKYCFDPQNTTVGATVNATVFGFLPDSPWEVRGLVDRPYKPHSCIVYVCVCCLQILWRAVVDNSVTGGAVDVYTGTAQTVMSFTFLRSPTFPYWPTVQLTSGENLLSNTIDWYEESTVCVIR